LTCPWDRSDKREKEEKKARRQNEQEMEIQKKAAALSPQ
jgi:hypothetical protein